MITGAAAVVAVMVAVAAVAALPSSSAAAMESVPMTIEADGIPLTMLGVAAGILILTGWVKQIYKGYQTKSLGDVSKFLMIFISAGAVLWLIYGVIVWDVFIIGTNVAAIFLMMTVLYMKHRYEGLLHERGGGDSDGRGNSKGGENAGGGGDMGDGGGGGGGGNKEQQQSPIKE